MTDHPLLRCYECQSGRHRDCIVSVRVVEYRTNYIRCQCDRFGHDLPRKLYCVISTRKAYG